MSGTFLLAGRFGVTTQLFAKALRLFAEQGVLVPAHVDPATGYRYSLMEQLPRARLIAKLRRIGLSVVRVAQLVEMSPEARIVELDSWLAGEKERHTA
jgi:DNA-binding transcriptional MerR regulator